MKKIGITILVVLGVLMTSIAYAANLYGIVSDKNGKPVEVKVTLKDDKGAAVGQPVTTL